jgi:catechol 2,3-dioxygenase-like lactoylglutathione lyase family enzyme
VITGAHAILFAEDAEAAHAFFRDVLEWPGVDAGDGWLIFKAPPPRSRCTPAPAGARSPAGTSSS